MTFDSNRNRRINTVHYLRFHETLAKAAKITTFRNDLFLALVGANIVLFLINSVI